MQTPTVPDSENTRLETLRALKILDTPAEERFDSLTRLAKRTFGVPTVLVSLIDENRQWFKSSLGIKLSETPREVSFCAHAIHEEEVLVVPDAKQDERFADNPLVAGETGIRFYAGYPLKAENGEKLGTLCIIDYKARGLCDEDITALEDLGTLVERELSAVNMATKDELTKLANRRGFTMTALQSLKVSLRHEVPVSLVYFDLNNFKSVNDLYGHDEGDNALITFAQNLKDTFRTSDVIARLGGDEFVVLMCDANKHQVEKAVTSLKKFIDVYNINSEKPYEISFAHGIAEYDRQKHNSIDALITEADNLMYANKNAKNANIVKTIFRNVINLDKPYDKVANTR